MDDAFGLDVRARLYSGAADGAGLDAWRLERLIGVVEHALCAPGYRRLYAGAGVRTWKDFFELPVISAADVVREGRRLLALPAQAVARAFTSGTTGAPKRIYFSRAELDATADYFYYGSLQFIKAGQSALLVYPCAAPDGAGRLFLRALKRIGARAIPLGVPADMAAAAEAVSAHAPRLVLCTPDTAFALADTACPRFDILLLSGGALHEAGRAMLKRRFNCEVFLQYGLTETCFGLGVECGRHGGYHLRHDYLVEILDAQNNALPHGETGRVVVTSLLCGALPLIRYDTGDMACLTRCACGARVLSPVLPRDLPKGYCSSLREEQF